MRVNSIKILWIVFALMISGKAISCTTAVISGKYTDDGRPIIWKLRDSDYVENKMMYFEDGRYTYIGLVNSSDIEGKEVWGGANSVGFAIMNSASSNVNLNDNSSKVDLEGVFMKKALQTCATLEDFEKLLEKTEKPMGLAAHFGVIDAKGGAAFYEVNNYTFTKFDANDDAIAPDGYVIRTNYSFTGGKDEQGGYGYIRFITEQDIFYRAKLTGQLNYKTIIKDFSRCFKHTLLNKDFRSEYEQIRSGEHFINSEDFITRNRSVASLVIQGVTKDEPKDLATIWTMVGYPNTCMVIPTWVRGGKNLPKMLLANESGKAPLNTTALKLKEQCYPITKGSGNKYMQISALINSENTGITQLIESAEDKIITATETKMESWTKNTPKKEEIEEFYNWLDTYTKETYESNFGVIMN